MMKRKKDIIKSIILILLTLSVSSMNLSAQYNPIQITPQMPTVPTPYSFERYDNTVSTQPRTNRNGTGYSTQRQQNTYPDDYERMQRENERRRDEELSKILNENFLLDYELPSLSTLAGTEYYRQAAEALVKMLQGKTPLSLKDAVFTVENAYYEDKLDKTKFNKNIENLVYLARQKTAEEKFNWNNTFTKNIMLYRIMTDTLKIRLPLQEKTLTTYPMQYDFDNFNARENMPNEFVSKLLETHKGQCHSLPLLYLILNEASGGEACLAYSPHHSYVKIKDKTGDWHNIELTVNRFTTDAFIVASGYVSAEAIKNRIYLEPQTKLQTIANCLNDLILGYNVKYGYDEFVNRYTDTVLKYDPKNFRALMLKSNYMTVRTDYVIRQIIHYRLSENTVRQRYPQVLKMVEATKNMYKTIDALGYSEMPEEAYKAWLESLNREKRLREEHEQKYKKILQMID
jgi:hypothetical protein